MIIHVDNVKEDTRQYTYKAISLIFALLHTKIDDNKRRMIIRATSALCKGKDFNECIKYVKGQTQ